MNFRNLFESTEETFVTKQKSTVAVQITEEKEPEEVLKAANIKIKSKFGTKFGTEFILAKEYPQNELEKVLTDFNVKYDGKSIFVMK